VQSANPQKILLQRTKIKEKRIKAILPHSNRPPIRLKIRPILSALNASQSISCIINSRGLSNKNPPSRNRFDRRGTYDQPGASAGTQPACGIALGQISSKGHTAHAFIFVF